MMMRSPQLVAKCFGVRLRHEAFIEFLQLLSNSPSLGMLNVLDGFIVNRSQAFFYLYNMPNMWSGLNMPVQRNLFTHIP